MVRTKAPANIAYSCFPSASDNDSSSDNEVQVEMGKKASNSKTLSKLRIKKVLEKQVPCTPDGMWTNRKVHFITKATAVHNTFYYRDLTREYSQQQPDAHPGRYDESEFNRKFASSPLNKDPYPMRENFLSLDPQEMDKAVRVAF